MNDVTLRFTGHEIIGFDRWYPTTCVVRNELNGDRRPDQVLMEKGGRVVKSGGTPYQPRPFPAGRWQISEVVWMPLTSIYWPVFIRTNAWQYLDYWEIDENECYSRPTGKRFRGHGYGIHHARLDIGGELVPSSTTLGCMNVLDPEDAHSLGEHIVVAMGRHQHIYIDVPEQKERK